MREKSNVREGMIKGDCEKERERELVRDVSFLSVGNNIAFILSC